LCKGIHLNNYRLESIIVTEKIFNCLRENNRYMQKIQQNLGKQDPSPNPTPYDKPIGREINAVPFPY